jgi:4-amino-4-deoxy-L-arabinose transferase-like glycosyltransferase
MEPRYPVPVRWNEPTVSSRRIEIATILAVLAFAVAVRWSGLSYGFPLIVHPDEPRIADAALHVVDTGDPHPRTLLYPSFLVYLNACVFAAVRAASSGPVEPATYYYWGRVATLAMALITVLIVYAAARRLAGFTAAAAGAMITAASLLHASNSVLITTDVPMAMWTTAAVAAALAMLGPAAGTSWTRYAFVGALVGLAVGTKYNAVVVAVAVACAHFVREKRLGALVDARLAMAAAVSVAAFVFVTPYAVLDSRMFGDFLALQRDAYSLGHAGNESVGTSYAFYATALVDKLGAVALLSATVGLAWLLLRDRGRALVAASFPLAYFAFMGAYPVHFDRNMTALVPVLAILAGVGVAVIARAAAKLAAAGGDRAARLAAAAAAGTLVALAALPQAAATEAHMARLALPDTRVLAKQWIEANLPAGSRIAREQYTPTLDTTRFDVVDLGYFGLGLSTDLESFDYLVASSGDYGRFFSPRTRYPDMHARYSEIFRRFPTVRRIAPVPEQSSGPVIRILAVPH